MSQPENNAILFIDEIHLIVGAGRTQGALDISNLLKPMLSRGEVQCIGATTQEEYRRYIEKDGALMRRFSSIYVREPNTEESIEILRGIKNHLEIYYELKIKDNAMVAAVRMSQRYLTDTYLPDKAIDLLDETCGRVRSEIWYEPEIISQTKKKLQELEIRQSSLSVGDEQELLELKQEIISQNKKLEELIRQNQKESDIIQELNNKKKNLAQARWDLDDYQRVKADYNKAGEIKYYLIPELEKKIGDLEKVADQNVLRRYSIGQEDIALTIAKKYDLAVGKILLDEQQKLLSLPLVLTQRIKGQNHALRLISDAIFRARTGIQDPHRPLASFFFLGPTGVGKTEVALTIAEQIFDQKKNFIRFDMTEFSEPHSVSKLTGAPPGYVGFEDKPRLEIIRENKNSVVLFDEVEKCHPEVINLLLQILDNGFLTLADGREVNFRNTIIILTSNLGSDLYFAEDQENQLESKLKQTLKNHFRPEFLNRLDEIIFFNSLTKEVICEIISKELELFINRVKQEKNIGLGYSKEIIEKILYEAYSPEYGARPIKRYIEKQLGTLIARGIITHFLQVGGSYLLELEKETNEIKITVLSLLEENKKKLLKEK